MVSKLESLEYNPSVKTLFQICKKLNLKLDISVTKVENATKSVLTRFVNKKEYDVALTKDSDDRQIGIEAA